MLVYIILTDISAALSVHSLTGHQLFHFNHNLLLFFVAYSSTGTSTVFSTPKSTSVSKNTSSLLTSTQITVIDLQLPHQQFYHKLFSSFRCLRSTLQLWSVSVDYSASASTETYPIYSYFISHLIWYHDQIVMIFHEVMCLRSHDEHQFKLLKIIIIFRHIKQFKFFMWNIYPFPLSCVHFLFSVCSVTEVAKTYFMCAKELFQHKPLL